MHRRTLMLVTVCMCCVCMCVCVCVCVAMHSYGCVCVWLACGTLPIGLGIQSVANIEEVEAALHNSEQRVRKIQEDLESVEALKKLIIDMYLEFQDRSLSLPSNISPEMELHELQEQSPFVIIEYLGAHLRFLLNFKDDFERELQAQLESRRVDSEVKVEALKRKIQHMIQDHQGMRVETEQAARKRKEAEFMREQAIRETDKIIERYRQENEGLIQRVNTLDQELDDLINHINERDSLIRKKEMRLMRISQLESQIEKNKIKHKFDLNRVRAENVNSKKNFQKSEYTIAQLEGEREELEDRLHRAREQLKELQRCSSRSLKSEVQQETERIEAVYHRKQQRIEELKERIKATKQSKDRSANRCFSLKSEYDRLFDEREQEEALRNKQSATGRGQHSRPFVVKTEDSSEFVGEFYQKKLASKDREIEDLTMRVRKLLLKEHSSSLAEQNLENERLHLEKELTKMRMMEVQEQERKMIAVQRQTSTESTSFKISRQSGGGPVVGRPNTSSATRSEPPPHEDASMSESPSPPRTRPSSASASTNGLSSSPGEKSWESTSQSSPPQHPLQSPGNRKSPRLYTAKATGRQLRGVGGSHVNMEIGTLLK